MTRKWTVIAIAIITCLLIVAIPTSYAAQNQEKPAQQAVLFFDDFNGTSIDTTKWVPGLHQWGGANNGVVPDNLSVHSYNDNGTTISVLDTVARGTQYTGPVRGIKSTNPAFPIGHPSRYTTQSTGQVTGGLVWTVQPFGGGRYEVRMKNLPGPNGCSCIWNYYEPVGDYTEIDIEMPAHENPAPAWSTWQRIAGLNSYYPSSADADATYINKDTGVNQFDGNFHVYRWDWYDGVNGSKRVDWYIDGVLQASTTQHVPSTAAQLWVGNWPAQWPGMNYNFDTVHLYVDWVKITALGGGGSPTSTPTATPTSGGGGGTNLIVNPGFETGSLSPWASWNNSVQANNARTGTYSMRVGTAEGSGEQVVTGLQPNTTYVLSGWVKTSATSVTANVGVKNFGGSQIFSGSTSTSYTQRSVTFTTGASNTSATVYCYKPTTTGYIYCDDMSLTVSGGGGGPTNTPTATPTRTPTPTPTSGGGGGTNLVLNPGYESNLTSWTCTGTAAAETANPRTGTKNLRLTPSSTTTARCQQTITVQPNSSYTLRAYIKTTGIYGYVGADGVTEQGGAATSYTPYSFTFTTGASQTSVTIYVHAWKQQTGSVYVDDVSLIKN